MLQPWQKGVFTRIEDHTPQVKRFWVQLPDVGSITFQPGQFMTFDLPIHEKKNRRWRSYSIASAPDSGNTLEFVIVRMDGGAGTRYLFDEVKVGDTLLLRGAQGSFVLPADADGRELCFICTGTGIAPFRSMLHDMHTKGTQRQAPMHLIFGTRLSENVLYRSEMEALCQSLPLNYHICLSRQQTLGAGERRGYVHAVYQEIFADHRDALFLICGWQAMLDEARQRLAEMGYDKKQIIFESYG